jgi:regulator of cell morphogenesis and NO signaling
MVCSEINFDANSFIFLANFHSGKLKSDISEMFNELPLEPFLRYLKGSHAYFLEEKLPNIKRKLGLVFSGDEENIKKVVLNFFDNYMEEVREHMIYEDEVVFPYINSLIGENGDRSYSIDIFKERHNDIEEKMQDLKQILMKYVSSLKDQQLMTNILLELYICQEELEAHTYIEDGLIIPRVRQIESTKNN